VDSCQIAGNLIGEFANNAYIERGGNIAIHPRSRCFENVRCKL
jgi:hypothetical protein